MEPLQQKLLKTFNRNSEYLSSGGLYCKFDLHCHMTVLDRKVTRTSCGRKWALLPLKPDHLKPLPNSAFLITPSMWMETLNAKDLMSTLLAFWGLYFVLGLVWTDRLNICSHLKQQSEHPPANGNTRCTTGTSFQLNFIQIWIQFISLLYHNVQVATAQYEWKKLSSSSLILNE